MEPWRAVRRKTPKRSRAPAVVTSRRTRSSCVAIRTSLCGPRTSCVRRPMPTMPSRKHSSRPMPHFLAFARARRSGRGCSGSLPTRRATGAAPRVAGPDLPSGLQMWPDPRSNRHPSTTTWPPKNGWHSSQRSTTLRDEDREVIGARFLLELSEAETAEALGIPRGTVKSRTSRALGRLREALAAANGVTRG